MFDLKSPRIRFSQRLRRLCLLLLLPMVAMACKSELYSGLGQSEANQMLSLLLKADIHAEKVFDKKGTKVSLLVEESDLARAIDLLHKNGLPHEKFTNPAQIFKDDGLISSPVQENARYVYALSQDLAETLSQLDGVLTARVHLVLQDPSSRKKDKKTASAGVLIRYARGIEIEKFTPQIKMLIMNSVEGISYENISVAFFPGAFSQQSEAESLSQNQESKVAPAAGSLSPGQGGAKLATSFGLNWLMQHKFWILWGTGLMVIAILLMSFVFKGRSQKTGHQSENQRRRISQTKAQTAS